MLVCIRYQPGALSHSSPHCKIFTTCSDHVICFCINTQSASMGRPNQALLQQWLVRQDSLKASKGGKGSSGEVAKVWPRLKSRALQNLVAWQDAVVTQDVLPSAADMRSACKVGHCDAERVVSRLASHILLPWPVDSICMGPAQSSHAAWSPCSVVLCLKPGRLLPALLCCTVQ